MKQITFLKARIRIKPSCFHWPKGAPRGRQPKTCGERLRAEPIRFLLSGTVPLSHFTEDETCARTKRTSNPTNSVVQHTIIISSESLRPPERIQNKENVYAVKQISIVFRQDVMQCLKYVSNSV